MEPLLTTAYTSMTFLARVTRIKEGLAVKFRTQDLGELAIYGACAIERNWEDGTVKISQSAFVDKIIGTF